MYQYDYEVYMHEELRAVYLRLLLLLGAAAWEQQYFTLYTVYSEQQRGSSS